MASNQLSLLGKQRFLPLFITQFMGGFHDNIFKNALVVMLLFNAYQGAEHNTELLVTLAAGLFILPFILFSAFGGQLASIYPKHKVVRKIKLAEVAIAALGSVALIYTSIPLSFAALFALGTQSALFGPSKYALLPEQLKEDELIGGNALLNTGTFLSILIGTICGTVLITLDSGKYFVCALMGLSALMGYMASRQIPEIKATRPEQKFSLNIFSQTHKILKETFSQKRTVIRSVLGVSWFYFIGGMFMSQFPNYTKGILGADETVLAFFLIIFSVSIALGGMLNNSLLKGRIEATYVPLAAVMMSLASIDLYFASPQSVGVAVLSLEAFLAQPANWRIVFDVFVIALAGGLFVVPLTALIQNHTSDKDRADVIAGSAILDALFIFTSASLCAYLLTREFDITEIFLTFAIMNALVAIYICRMIPEYLMKSILQIIFKSVYKVEVRGLENFDKAGDRVVIIGNHVSLLDPPLLAAFLPGKPMFAVNSFVAEWFWVKPFLKLVDAFPLDPTNPFSVKSLINEVEKDKKCVIFPEGRLTETGALMKVYEGPGMIADKADAMVLPIRLDGVQHTPFARLKGKVPLKSFPKITITILEPRKLDIDENIKGRARRAEAGAQLHKVMEDMMFITQDREDTLFENLLKARFVNGDNEIIVEDAEFKPMKFKRLVQSSLILGDHIANMSEQGENIGVLLPNSVGAVTTFFALQAYGRVPAMLNFSAGSKALVSACQTAQVKTVLTSRRFIELGRLEDVIEDVSAHAEIVYLEDVKEQIGSFAKIKGLLSSASRVHKKYKADANDPALILFTSGSEGTPKAVVLSHQNIMSNIIQMSSRVDFNRQDIVFNCLPMFHSFGLTGGTLLPILSGVKTFLYPSPLHYRIVPELVYSTNATIMFGTDTFLNGYARMANPYDFYRMRYIFAGAEKVKDETRHIYMERFGVRVLEGYGATETAPALSINSPMHTKAGTVGRLLAGIEHRLEDVPGVDEGGRLFVKGPNVMLGYYLADNPGVLVAPDGGWYDTGDIVDVDDQGYIKILGRAKRFAKIAGEMVSLTSVEAMVQKVYPDGHHAIVSIPDSRKGEQLIFVTTQKGADKKDLSGYAKANGISELAVPKTILEMDKIPVLGSGKTDYTTLQAHVDENYKVAA